MDFKVELKEKTNFRNKVCL